MLSFRFHTGVTAGRSSSAAADARGEAREANSSSLAARALQRPPFSLKTTLAARKGSQRLAGVEQRLRRNDRLGASPQGTNSTAEYYQRGAAHTSTIQAERGGPAIGDDPQTATTAIRMPDDLSGIPLSHVLLITVYVNGSKSGGRSSVARDRCVGRPCSISTCGRSRRPCSETVSSIRRRTTGRCRGPCEWSGCRSPGHPSGPRPEAAEPSRRTETARTTPGLTSRGASAKLPTQKQQQFDGPSAGRRSQETRRWQVSPLASLLVVEVRLGTTACGS